MTTRTKKEGTSQHSMQYMQTPTSNALVQSRTPTKHEMTMTMTRPRNAASSIPRQSYTSTTGQNAHHHYHGSQQHPSTEQKGSKVYDRENVTDSRRWVSLDIGEGAMVFAGDANNNANVGDTNSSATSDKRAWEGSKMGKNSSVYFGDRNFEESRSRPSSERSLSSSAQFRTRYSVTEHRSMEFDRGDDRNG